jgi:hypothetical protein
MRGMCLHVYLCCWCLGCRYSSDCSCVHNVQPLAVDIWIGDSVNRPFLYSLCITQSVYCSTQTARTQVTDPCNRCCLGFRYLVWLAVCVLAVLSPRTIVVAVAAEGLLVLKMQILGGMFFRTDGLLSACISLLRFALCTHCSWAGCT